MAVNKTNKGAKDKTEEAILDPKLKKREEAKAALRGKFGQEVVVGGKPQVDRIPTGLLGFDTQLYGGWPVGRIGEFYGWESSGKTTAAQLVIEAHQAREKQTYFVDAEQALDRSYSAKLGVNVDDMIVTQPDNAEQALEAVIFMAEQGLSDLTVVDSVSALVPKAELEGEMGDSHMGLQARLMSQSLRKVLPFTFKNKSSLIFINQLRMKIGKVYGNPEVTSGGNGLKFYASVRIDVKRIEAIKDGETVIGNKVRFKIVKNKVGTPYLERTYDLIFSKGYDRVIDLFDVAVEQGIIDKAGSWYSYNGVKLGQGRDNAVLFMRSSKRQSAEILKSTVEVLVSKDQLPESYLSELDFVISLMKFNEGATSIDPLTVEAEVSDNKTA